MRTTCGVCRAAVGPVCSGCASTLAPARSLPLPLDLDQCAAAFDYAAARPLLTSLKNGDRRDLVGWLADAMAEVGAFAVAAAPPGLVVTWAPTGLARRRDRGFDQAELLAKAVARRLHQPCRSLLIRTGGAPQAGRTASDRRANPAFRAGIRVPGAVLVIDDVVTTGATVSAAARALRRGGAAHVAALAAARTATPRHY